MSDSLWGEEFELPNEKEKAKKVIKKTTSKPKEVKVKKEKTKKVIPPTMTLRERLKLITEEVYRVLGKQKDNILVIKDKETFHNYVDDCIKTGRIAIDTETNNSTDPVTCKLMGLCLYSPGLKQAYIPVNHRDPDTKEKLEWQLTEEDIREELQRIVDSKIYIIMHNGKFDYEVLWCTCRIKVKPNWDTLIGAKLIDENRFDKGQAGLKPMYRTLIDPEQEKYDIEQLFEGVEYADVDPDVFAFYAATDSMMTDKVFDWEMNVFANPDLKDVLKLANEVEMPVIQALAEMEMNGMAVYLPYAERLKAKYNRKLNRIDTKIQEILDEYKDKINEWKKTDEATRSQKKKLSEKQYIRAKQSGSYDPTLYSFLNGEVYKVSKSKLEQLGSTDLVAEDLSSPTKLGILLYDILKCPVVNKEKPMATGEEELVAIKKQTNLEICDLLLDRRETVKLLSTYIETIPELAKRWPDGRVRTHFNQYGAATGRLSSSDPINFQNIPSHEKSIRMLFAAKEGYRICGADYSAQEPRLTAFMSQDPAMIKAYNEGKDLYSVIASMSFNRKYEDCLEFYPEGTKVIVDGKEVIAGHKNIQNKEGKNYRTMAKSILLGIEYGRGAASVGEQIGKTKEEAQGIIDSFFKAFPAVKKFIDESIESAKKNGYVTDVVGRRRRLPDAQLPKYDIHYVNKEQAAGLFNPFLICEDRTDDKKLKEYEAKLEKIKYNKQYQDIQKEALANGIEIHNNQGFIAQAERQAVNARIQGGAATLTKCALISIYNDQRLRDLGAFLINSVHDEILIEAPEENAELASKYLCENMIDSAKKYVTNVPMASDAYVVPG